MHYIVGGHLPDLTRDHPGCPDKTPPRDAVATEVPGTLYFATHPDFWSGLTPIFFDSKPGNTIVKARGYLITLDQLQHILAQENGSKDGPIPVSIPRVKAEGQVSIGDEKSFYNELVYLGERQGYPMVTFTTSRTDLRLNPPEVPYLRLLVRGLKESYGVSTKIALNYFCGMPGAKGHDYTAAELRELAR
jgi:hypothetical protein